MTRYRSPEVSSTAFSAQPPDLQPASLMDIRFIVVCQLAQRRMPRIWFVFLGSHLCSTLPSDAVSRRRPCASLTLHVHQVEQRTFTSWLSNMLSTQTKASGLIIPRRLSVKRRRNCPATALVARATAAITAAASETASTATAIFASLGFVDV